MRTRLLGLALATLAGASLGACQLVLGISDRDTGTGARATGSGGASASSTTESSSSGRGGGGRGTGGADAGDGGDGGDAAPPSRVLWAKSYGGVEPGAAPTVTGLAVGPDSSIYLTGLVNGFAGFGCPSSTMTDGGTGYLVQLDATGACTWLLLFGNAGLTGTGVAVDPTTGNVVLTASFSDSLTLDTAPVLVASGIDSVVASFGIDRKIAWFRQITDATGYTLGDQAVMSVTANDGMVAVGGYYNGTLAVKNQSMPIPVQPQSKGEDAFLLVYNADGSFYEDVEVTSPDTSDQVVTGVSINGDGTVAITGTTTGKTQFAGAPAIVPTGGTNVMLAAYASPNHPLFQTVLGDLQGNQRNVAFDASGNILLGTTFTGTFSAPSDAQDGGTAFMTQGGTTALLAAFAKGTDVNCVGGTTFGPAAPTDLATLAGPAPFAGTSVALAGGFTGSASFMGASGVVSNGGNDVYVAKLDATLASVLWIERYGDSSDQAADAVAVDPKTGEVVIAGHYAGTLDFGAPNPALQNPNSSTPEMFLAKLKP